jgi:hypothetical protein
LLPRDIPERARADALRSTIDELKAGQALMVDIHARELAVTRQDAQAIQEWAADLRQAQTERKARGACGAVRAALRGSSRPSAFPVAILPGLGRAWHRLPVVSIGKNTIAGDHQ